MVFALRVRVLRALGAVVDLDAVAVGIGIDSLVYLLIIVGYAGISVDCVPLIELVMYSIDNNRSQKYASDSLIS